ncbi:YbaN family protein [Ferrimonas balearica]|uniref:YbaN family protein n=1 Tax=Ferrimonas balearica TaxID=44012 RepID=UPI001FEE8182|nr:YbaN family protein [Ferrimonas balearica]
MEIEVMCGIDSKNRVKCGDVAAKLGSGDGLVAAPFRPLLMMLGWLAIAMGSAGVVVPLLPTVPFLLLAAFCFSRSSPRLQRWLFEHRVLGPYLHNFVSRKGLTRTQLQRCLLGKWLGMGIAILLVPLWSVKVLLLAIATGVSVYLMRLKRLPEPGGY